MSEEPILNAAATIFSGLCASGIVDVGNDKNAKKYALATALQFAAAADKKTFAGLATLAGGEVPFPHSKSA